MNWVYLLFAVCQGEPVAQDFQLGLPLAGRQMRLELFLPVSGEQRLEVAYSQPLAG